MEIAGRLDVHPFETEVMGGGQWCDGAMVRDYGSYEVHERITINASKGILHSDGRFEDVLIENE